MGGRERGREKDGEGGRGRERGGGTDRLLVRGVNWKHAKELAV